MARKRWEYRIMNYGGDLTISTERLNVQGADGWELVVVLASSAGVYFVFKRELES